MKPIKFLLIMLVVSFISPSISSGEKIVVMGWDSVGRSTINQLMTEHKLPNLQRLLDSGGVLVETENITVTATVPGWTQVFTGQTYDQSGTYSNNSFTKSIPFNETLPGALKTQKGLKIGWFSSKYYWSSNCYGTSICLIAQNADKYSDYRPQKKGDIYLDNLTTDAMNFIQTYQDNYFVGFLCNPDQYGHEYGKDSKRYLFEVERCDAVLGKFLKLGADIVVVSDHGFDAEYNATTHNNAPWSFMATNLPVKRRGTLRDVAKTLFNYYNLSSPVFLRGNNLIEKEALWR